MTECMCVIIFITYRERNEEKEEKEEEGGEGEEEKNAKRRGDFCAPSNDGNGN